MGGTGEFRIWIPAMESGRNPDVAVVFSDAAKDADGHRPPGFVAEVVSRGGEDRDYVEESEEYLGNRIKEYWIVDPFQKKVTVKVRVRDGAGASYWQDRVARGAERIPSEVFRGLDATVESLRNELDAEDA